MTFAAGLSMKRAVGNSVLLWTPHAELRRTISFRSPNHGYQAVDPLN